MVQHVLKMQYLFLLNGVKSCLCAVCRLMSFFMQRTKWDEV